MLQSGLVQIFVGMPPINAFNVARQALHLARTLTTLLLRAAEIPETELDVEPDRDVAIEETIGRVPTPNRSP